MQQIIATKCIDTRVDSGNKEAFYPRGEGNCSRVESLDEAKSHGYTADQIVFSFQFPLPRDNQELTMSRWFQHIVSVLYVDMEYNSNAPPGLYF